MALEDFPELLSERLILNQLIGGDREVVYSIFSDPDVVENYDVELFKDIAEADNLIDYFNTRFKTGTGIRWAVREKESQKLIGTVGFTTWNEYDHSAMIGYDLAKEYWGRGYGNEMVVAILQYVFSEAFPFFVNRIEALILPQNQPSQSLVKKCGFQFEGRMRQKCYWNQGFHDMYLFSLLREDWQALVNASHTIQ